MSLFGTAFLDSTINAAIFGLAAGTIHHFLFQYPHQAHVFTTLYGFGILNAGFLILEVNKKGRSEPIVHQIILKFVCLSLFNAIYVSPFEGSLNWVR
jgi:hypothetical protein